MTDTDRRSEARIPFVAPVTVYGGSKEELWQAQNLSLAGGGMFVATRSLLPIGTAVEIGFRLPGYGLEIVTEAAVAWINDPTQPDYDAGKPKGMGLTFNDLEPEFQKVLLQYVQQRKEIDDELALLEIEVEGASGPDAVADSSNPPAVAADALGAQPTPASGGDTDGGLAFPVVIDEPEGNASSRPGTGSDPAGPFDDGLELSLDDLVSDNDVPGVSVAPGAEEESANRAVDEAASDLPDLPAGETARPALAGLLTNADGSLINDLIADSLAELDTPEEREKPAIETPFSRVEAVAARAEARPVLEEQEADTERLDPGAVLGSYRIVKWLGSGGMGDVYLAEHTQLGRKVAIKRLRSEYARNKRALQRFFDEARAVNRIQHENIVQITDFASEDEHVYCVMEFLEGRTLADLQTQVGAVPLDQVLPVAIQVCDALEVVHKAGVIHRDLKPQNIMLIQQGDHTDRVKLLDFGVAKLKAPEGEAASLESTGSTLLGTPGYMSPEQLLGNPVDHRADIYALGVILYQMATGTNPFIADTWGQAVVKHATHVPPRPSQLKGAQRLPAQLEEVILRCLEKDPTHRPSGVGEVAKVLHQLTGLVAAGGDFEAYATRGVPRRGRIRGVAGAIAGLGGIAVAFVLLGPSMPGLGNKLPWSQSVLSLSASDQAEPPGSAATSANSRAPEPVSKKPDSVAAEPQSVSEKSEVAQKKSRAESAASRATGFRAGRRRSSRDSPVAVRTALWAKPEPSTRLAPKPAAVETPPPEKPATAGKNLQPVVEPAPAPAAPIPQAKPAPKPAEPKPVESKPVEPKPVEPKPAEPKPVEPKPAAVLAVPTAESHYSAGRELLKSNKALLAIEEFKKAIKINSRHAKSYRMMGRAYLLLGREEKAIEAFEAAVELAPGNKSTPKLQAIIDQYRNR
jgi:serine/threonine-protein kinase